MQKNVVWITLESVRSDYTSLGESAVASTPNLEQIATADSGRSFSNCYAHARWTPASTGSILTGTCLSSHRVGYADTTDVKTLPKGLSTVPELLAQQGYRTACFSGNGYLSSATGLDRGFDHFEQITKKDFLSLRGAYTLGDYLRNIRQTGAKASLDPAHHKDALKERYQTIGFRRWLQTHAEGDAPAFAYMHLNNPHHPYRPPLAMLERVLGDSNLQPADVVDVSDSFSDSIWDLIADGDTLDSDRRKQILAAYEGEIRYADHLLGTVFEYIQSRNDTILIITADHGELFGERGVFGHNLVLHDKLLHVPMVTYGIDFEGVSDDDLVQHIDVMQTVLETVGADTSQFQGYDLTSRRREFVIAERGPRPSDLEELQDLNPAFDTSQFHEGAVRCLRSDSWKYKESNDRVELFRLPDEETDRSDESPERRDELADALAERLPKETFESAQEAEFDAETEEQLRHMGYID